jgi:hypothetical protein
MITLTLTARGIRDNYIIPNVQVMRPNVIWYDKLFILEDGSEIIFPQQGIAIDKDVFNKTMSETGGIFIIETRLKNNEERDFVRLINVRIVNEIEGDFIIEGGISQRHLFVTESNMELNDGDEIFVIN